MATLFVRTRVADDGSKRYSVVYRRGGRYYPVEHAGTFKTQREALLRKQLVADLLAAGKNPRVELAAIATQGRTLEQLFEEWLASKRGLKAGTKAGHRDRLPVLVKEFDRPVDEITVAQLIGWVGKLERDYKPGTIGLFFRQLRAILDYADLPANPARSRKIELPRTPVRTLVPPTAAQVVAAAAKVADDLVAPLVMMEQLGTRVTETMALERRDVDVTGQRVLLRGENVKTDRSRWVPAPDMLVDALMDRLPFHGSRDRAAGALRHVEAGFSPHGLRHRRASLWLAQGLPPATVAAWLGHSVDTLLRTYTHVIVDEEISGHDLASLLR